MKDVKYPTKVTVTYVPETWSNDGMTKTRSHYVATVTEAPPQMCEAWPILLGDIKAETEERAVSAVQAAVATHLPRIPNRWRDGETDAVREWDVDVEIISRHNYTQDELNRIAAAEAKKKAQAAAAAEREKKHEEIRQMIKDKCGTAAKYVHYREYASQIQISGYGTGTTRTYKPAKDGSGYKWDKIIAAAEETERIQKQREALHEQDRIREKAHRALCDELKVDHYNTVKQSGSNYVLRIDVPADRLREIIAAIRDMGIEVK